jgi:hypothetical protein
MFNETYNIKGTSKTARGCFDKKVQYFYTWVINCGDFNQQMIIE